MSRIRVRSRVGITALAAVAAMGAGAVITVAQSHSFVSAYVGETCNGEEATIVGTPGPDYLFGTNGRDVIVGKGGFDTIIGRQGDDVICGNGGPDDIFGGPGNDVILGGDGNDWIYGRDGDDDLRGGGGRDFIVGNQGADTIKGAGGNDELWGDGGNDTIDGGVGADYIEGGPGGDFLTGGAGPDDIFGGLGGDTLLGEGGSDYLNGGVGFDTCDLGPGGSIETKCENARPQAVDQSESAVEDGGPVSADYATTDPDGDGLTFEIVDEPAEGSANDDENGVSFTFDPGDDFQDLADGETRDVTFTYEATDENGATSEIATVTVTVTGVNDAPAAEDVVVSTAADTEVTASFDADDVDSDDDPGSLVYSIVDEPTRGTVSENGDGTFTFDPNDSFNQLLVGETAEMTFTYEATDSHSATSNVATVTVTVIGAGIRAVDDSYDAGESGSLTVGAPAGVLGNDIGAGLTADAIVDGLSSNGAAIDVNSDGSFAYDLGAAFTALAADQEATDQFQYTATNGSSTSNANVTVTVTGVNDAPTADATEVFGSVIDITLTGTDPDIDDDLKFTVDTNGTLGTVTNLTNSDGTCSPQPCTAIDKNSATVVYTAPAGEPEDSFSFTVDDLNGGMATATVTVNLDPGTEPPEDPPAVTTVDAKPNPPEQQIEETTTGSTLDITIVADAPDTTGNLEFEIVAQPDNGEGTVSNLTPSPDDPVRAATVTYDPGTFGTTDPGLPPEETSFTFEACDPGGACDTAVVDVRVAAAAPLAPPVVSNVEAAVVQDGTALLDLQLGGNQTGEQPPDDPTDGRGVSSFRGFPMTTFDDENTFLGSLTSSTTYDFEQPTFPASSANIFDAVGLIDGIEFDARIGTQVNPTPPSGSQHMRGTGQTIPYGEEAVIDFTGLASPIDSIGFFVLNETVFRTDFVRVQIFGPDLVLMHEEFIPQNIPLTFTYFGYNANDEIVEVRFLGFEDDLETPNTVDTFGIDDLTIGVAAVTTGPDLVVDSLTHEPDVPNTEEKIRFEAVVKNIGDDNAGASILSLKVGGESPSSPSALFPVPPLAPGETFRVVREEILGIPQNYQNTAQADFEEDVAETDEGNNTTLDFYTVTDPQDPAPPAIFTILTPPEYGVLIDSEGFQITSYPAQLIDSMVMYVADEFAPIGEIDQFNFQAENAGGIKEAIGYIEIVQFIPLPDDCALVGRPPGCED